MNITISYNDLTTSFTIHNIELQEEILKHRNQSEYIQNLLLTGFTISKTIKPTSLCGCCHKIDELAELMTPFNTGGNSSRNGQIGEIFASTLFTKRNPHITYIDTAKIEKSGDAIIELHNHSIDKIMIDYKNYDSPIPSDEINKLVRDLHAQNINYGILLSYKSKISKQNYIDYQIIDGKLLVFVAAYGLNIFTLEMSIQYIQRLHECNTLSISDKISDMISQGISKEITTIYEELYSLSCQFSQSINTMKENQDKMNKMFYNMINSSQRIQTSMNLLVDKSSQLSKDVYKEPLSTYNSYSELYEMINTLLDKEKDKILSKRILNITRDLDIYGSYSDIDNCIHFNPFGKLQFAKSKVTMIFYNNSEDECSYNRKYETIKNDNFHIILTDDSEKWNIIERRFLQN